MLDGGLRVELNGFRFYGVDDTGCEWLANSVDGGWNGAGTSHEHSSRAWGDGWVSNASHRQGRNLTVSGSVWAPDQQALDASRQRMLGSVPMDDGELTVELDGVSRLWRVKQDSGEVLISRRGPHIWDFSIPLVSLSPYSFDAGDPLFGSTGLAATSGGMSFPAAFDGSMDGWVFTETVISGEVNLTNPGGAPSPVTLRVDGPVDGPRIEHQQSGGVLELGLSLGSGHYVLFDSQSRQVLIDGRDPARGAVLRRGWSDALPGANTWSFTAKESSPVARLTVSFRPAYL